MNGTNIIDKEDGQEMQESMLGRSNAVDAGMNVDAFWQNPYALSMVSSKPVDAGHINQEVDSDVEADADDADVDADADDAEDNYPSGFMSQTAANTTGAANRRRKYGSHLCPVCSRSFGQKMVMYEHLNLHYGVRPHFCAVCGIRFASCSNLIKHRQLHRKQFTCVLCGDRSPPMNSFSDVQNHVLAAHPDVISYRCTVCQSNFNTQGQLADHVIIHPPLVLETRLEGKDKRKRNKPLVQLSDSTAKKPALGPTLRSGLRSGEQPGHSNQRAYAHPDQTAPTGIAPDRTTTRTMRPGSHVDIDRLSMPDQAAVVAQSNAADAAERGRLDGQMEQSSNGNRLPAYNEDKLFESLLQKKVANGELFRCTVCDILFFDRAMFSVHRCTHEENNPLRCAMCRTLCTDRYEFALHCVKTKVQDTNTKVD